MLEIPTRNDLADYTEQVEILGTLYTLGFHWNTRDESWLMDIMSEDGTPILMGQKLVGDWKVTDRFVLEALPAGFFFTVDQTGEKKAPGRNDLGDDVMLIFVEDAELGR